MQYSFSPCPLLSKLSDFGMYLIAAVSAVLQGCQYTLRLISSSKDYRNIESSEYFSTLNDVVLNDAFNILGEVLDAIEDMKQMTQKREF
jgi:hypothetical protein